MPDLLGPDYVTTVLPLAGDDIATLVSLDAPNPRGTILYVHGFVDYFFHDHMARHFVATGWSFAAIDLRRCGRSIRTGDEPWYTDDLKEYYEELDLAIQVLRERGATNIVLMGHSTGGLIASLWAHDHRNDNLIDALILNSPWLDAQRPWFTRTVVTWALRGLGALRPMMNSPEFLEGPYAGSVHADAHGEWQFDTAWKPLDPVPVKMGFLASVRREQARLHRGLDVRVPVLMIRSTVSRLDLKEWSEAAQSADTMLDVEQMKKWLPSIGSDVTDVPIEGALHDVMLSRPAVREKAQSVMDVWLSTRLPG